MGQDDMRTSTPVQPAASQDRKGPAQLVTNTTSHQRGQLPNRSLVLSGIGQEIPHRNFQAVGGSVSNQNAAVKNALSSDQRWVGHSDNNLPIPAGSCDPTMSEEDMLFMLSSSHICSTTLPVSVAPQNTMPAMSAMTVLESPMVTSSSSSTSLQGGMFPVVSSVVAEPYNSQLQQQQQQQQQADSSSYHTEPASLEDLMDEADEPMYDFGMGGQDAMALPMDASSAPLLPPQLPGINQCPTGSGSSNSGNGGGSQAESGSGGQGHCVTGYSHQNYGPSMVTGGGGGLGGSGGDDDDPFKNNRPIQRGHYTDGNVFVDDAEDILRIIGDFGVEDLGHDMSLIPTLETSEIFSDMDHLPLGGHNATTPADNTMDYYSKFDSSGGGLQPMEESSIAATDKISPVPAAPRKRKMPISVPVSDSIGNSFDMIKMMKTQRKPLPINNNGGSSRPSELLFQPPSPATSYVSAASPADSVPPPTPSTPQLSFPVQVSTPQQQQQPLPQRAPSMPPPSPASPPTPVNVRPFDCRRYEENEKLFLELHVRQDLPREDKQLALKAFFGSVQFCMDLGEMMRNPCNLMISNHVCAKICDFSFDSEQSKLVFSFPADCKPVNQWLADRGPSASFLDRHTVLQQVLNTMATIHNNGRDRSLWGTFMVFVAPDLRVYLVPDIVPMLCKMQATVGDPTFNPRFDDGRAIYELYQLLIPPTINQGSSWISPGVSQLLQSFLELVCQPSCVSKMAEIARTLGEKMMCRMEVDYLGLARFDIYCVEHELVLKALSSIQSMVPDGAVIVWVPSCQPVAIQDLATAVRPMRLRVSYS